MSSGRRAKPCAAPSLSVVYGIVRQSGGFIAVTSEPGRGTDFWIYLLAVPETPKPILDTEQGPIRGGSETILLAEDEPALRQKLREVLERAGYQVLVAADGDEGLQLALRESQPIHLLLTDVVIPGMSGSGLAERLRTLFPHLRILYISGYPNGGDKKVDLPLEATFIQKPFNKEKLLRRVREVLDRNLSKGQGAYAPALLWFEQVCPCGPPCWRQLVW